MRRMISGLKAVSCLFENSRSYIEEHLPPVRGIPCPPELEDLEGLPTREPLFHDWWAEDRFEPGWRSWKKVRKHQYRPW